MFANAPIVNLLLSVCLSPWLAQTPAMPDPSSYESAGWLLLGLGGLAFAANNIMGVTAKFRTMRAPDPSEVSTDRIKALEDKVSNIELRMERQMGTIDSKLETMAKSLSQIVADFNYTIGKLDGRNSNYSE